ncbi:MAG: toxin-antitoxin system, antitoxin component, Xre family protein [Deltaproteobacteria bacterium]|nr:toxin-antitoxin system, antitoxin component, Xre family protein [Deltaproteobacteria bacterium]
MLAVKERIINEIDRLPESYLSEVFDFILFLESKKEKTLMAKASQQLSTASFEKIWDNEEDAVYDKL